MELSLAAVLGKVAEQEAVERYHAMLERKWHALYDRRDRLSALASIAAAAALAGGGAIVAVAVKWPHLLPAYATIVAIAAAVFVPAFCQLFNRRFVAIEGKLFAARRLRAKRAWVEKRMQDFYDRRERSNRQADIFRKPQPREAPPLPSLHTLYS